MEKKPATLIDRDRTIYSDEVYVYLASDVDARIAKLERVRLAASRYFENYLLDEAEDRLVCHSDEQHEMAQALRDALNSCSLMET
jgi:hypothetical protein